MYRRNKLRRPNALTEHRCDSCGRSIEAGKGIPGYFGWQQLMWYVSGFASGMWITIHWDWFKN